MLDPSSPADPLAPRGEFLYAHARGGLVLASGLARNGVTDAAKNYALYRYFNPEAQAKAQETQADISPTTGPR